VAWTALETDTAALLEAEGFARSEALIVTALASHRYARTLGKLIDVLSGHTGLENIENTQRAVTNLVAADILIITQHGHQDIITLAPDVSRILEDSGKSAAAVAVATLEQVPVARVRALGPMAAKAIVVSFAEAIATAERVIRLPFFSSTATIEGIDALSERAHAGVEVRVMLASPEVMSKLRGASHAQRTKRAIASWRETTRHWPNTELRVATRAEDVELGGSMSIDTRLLRLDVHEPLAERSIYGEMIEVNSAGGNVIRMFDSYFDQAWMRARPVHWTARAARLVASWKWAVVSAAAILAIVYLPSNSWRELVIGIAATSILAAADESSGRVKLLWRRLAQAIRDN